MTRRAMEVAQEGYLGPGLNEGNLAPRTGLRNRRESYLLRSGRYGIGTHTATSTDVTVYTAGPQYVDTQIAARQASMNPLGLLPQPCTPCVTLIHSRNPTTSATGAGRANNGQESPAKTFQVRLTGLDQYGFPVVEELPLQTVDEPNCNGSRHTVWASKIFSRVTKWEYKYTNMQDLSGAQFDQLQVGWDFNFNRNKPIYLYQIGTSGSYDFTYKGQTVNIPFATHTGGAAGMVTAIEGLSNIGAGEVTIDEPFGMSGVGGTPLQPYRIWIDGLGSGSGTPMTGSDSDDRDNIYVDQNSGDMTVWLASPRYINQDNQGIALPLISDVYGPPSPHDQAEIVSAHLMDMASGVGASVWPVARNAAGVRISAGVEVGQNAAGANARHEPNKLSMFLERHVDGHELFLQNGQILPWDVLYDDLAMPTMQLTVEARTTRGMGRSALNKSAYVNG